MSTESAPVTIELFRADYPETLTEFGAAPASGARVLQNEAVEEVKKLVKNQVDNLGDFGRPDLDVNALYYPRSHRAILIEGGRGSGKTTALLKLMQELREEQTKEVCVLQMIDPTLIETKDHIILVILQMIDSQVGESVAESAIQEKLDLSREALAEGLALLEGIGPKDAYGSDWEDPNWVMSEGLRKAKKGRLFERKFNEYLEYALQILKRKAFVLAFDDVDTNFERGYTILETIRKYLTSPRLCLILSGDLDLYGRLVRKHIYATFGSSVLTHDQQVIPAAKNSLAEATLELEEQYLLKILPPQFRVKMQPLSVLMRRLNQPVQVQESPEGAAVKLEEWAGTKVQLQLREEENNAIPAFLNVVFAEHLRLVLGYLRGLALAGEKTEESRAKVLQVFGTRLRAAGVSDNLIRPGLFDFTIRKVFEWVARKGEPSTLISFRNSEDPEDAIVLHCMAIALADGLKDGGSVLKALFGLALPAAMMKETRFSAQEQHEAIIKFLWRRGEILLPDAAARMIAIQRGGDQRGRMRASVFGSVGVAREINTQTFIERAYGKISLGSSVEQLKDTVAGTGLSVDSWGWLEALAQTDAKGLDPRKNIVWFPVDSILGNSRCGEFEPVFDLLTLRHPTSSEENLYSASALSIFAAAGDILLRDKFTKEDIIKLSMREIIPYFGQGSPDVEGISNKRSATKKGASKSESALDHDDDDILDRDDAVYEEGEAFGESFDRKAYEEFCGHLTAWREFARKLDDLAALSPTKLGDLANRINDDLRDFDDLRGKDMPTVTGQILHRQITTILNAIVVVASDLSGRRESPKTSDAPFGRALRRAQHEKLHPFAAVMLSCPLVWAFLDSKASFDQSATSNESLRETAVEALKSWASATLRENEPSPDFDAWITPPSVTVKIGNIAKAGTQRTVKIKGFYDLLNVVPPYAEALP